MSDPAHHVTHHDAVRCALAGIAAVDPVVLVERALTGHSHGPNVSLVAVGKAAGGMAAAVADMLGPYLRRGIVIAPTAVSLPGAPIVAYCGGHPIPTSEGVRAAEAVHRLVGSLASEDVLLCAISGGASALMTLPPDDVPLDDVRDVTRLLLDSGATIDELNCVRKHLDRLKGGRLAALAFPARVEALVLSDVIGDPIATIASGPTVPDPTTVQDAIDVLLAHELWERISERVRDHLEGAPESPKPGDMRFARTRTRIIGSNSMAAEGAAAHARSLGYDARIVTAALAGEAREAGARIASEALGARAGAAQPLALVYGGETTVTVTGAGLGGRNQELALAAAVALEGVDGVTVASIGTDGIDGPTDAAGAVADGTTVARATQRGLDARAALRDNDSYRFWTGLGDVVTTGPTGTNVMDLVIVTVMPRDA